MERLPVELRREILQCLDLPSLKSIRETSKVWATLGEEYLLAPNLTTYPHRDDFTRLQSLAQHPRLASYIESLEINLGEVNEYHARHNTYFLQYAQEPDYRDQVRDEAWAYHGNLKLFREIYAPKVCEISCLKLVFQNMLNLKSISVSLHKCPGFVNSLFRDIWRFPSTRALPRVLTWERFTSVLAAVSSSPIHLEHLSHDRLPFEFFAQRPLVISQLSTSFNNLQSLNLQIDYSDSPNNIHKLQAMSRLSQCLHSAPLLQGLSLGFQGRTKVDISALLFELEAHSTPSLKHLKLEDSVSNFDVKHNGEDAPKFLGSPTFPHLETLRLEGIAAEEAALGEFVTRHSSTLRRLQLGGPGIEAPHRRPTGGVNLITGTFKGLLTEFKDGLELEKFNAHGEVREVDSGVVWDVAPVYDEGWRRLPWVMEVARDFEGFVVRGGEWPD